MGMDDTIFNYGRDWIDWRIAEYSSDENRFGRIYYRGFNDDIGCRGGEVICLPQTHSATQRPFMLM